MAGAVIASTQAGPSMWYNPARLRFAGEQQFVFAVSGVGAALRRYKIPSLVSSRDAQLDATTNEILPLPRATTLVVRGRNRLHWGIGLFIPTRQDIGLQAGASTPGAMGHFDAYAVRLRRNSYHLTGSVSYTFSDRLQFGVSLGAVTYTYFNMSQISTAVYDSATGLAQAVTTSASQRDAYGYGFRTTFGMSVKLVDGLTLGISAAPPTALFYSSVREVSTVLGTREGGVQIQPFVRDQSGGAWEVVEAAVFRLGLAYQTERTLWELDGEVKGGARSVDFDVDERVTGNFRAGGIIGLQQHIRLGFGFFTDLDHPRGTLDDVGDTRMSGLGGTTGVNFVSRLPGQGGHQGTYSITVAARYARFKGQVMGVSIAETGAIEALAEAPVDGVIHELSGQIGINGAW